MSTTDTGFFTNGVVITPSDTTDLTQYPMRGLKIGVGGDITVITIGGDTLPFTVQSGEMLVGRMKQVLSTGTTASNIVAIW